VVPTLGTSLANLLSILISTFRLHRTTTARHNPTPPQFTVWPLAPIRLRPGTDYAAAPQHVALRSDARWTQQLIGTPHRTITTKHGRLVRLRRACKRAREFLPHAGARMTASLNGKCNTRTPHAVGIPCLHNVSCLFDLGIPRDDTRPLAFWGGRGGKGRQSRYEIDFLQEIPWYPGPASWVAWAGRTHSGNVCPCTSYSLRLLA